jgi:hypothetical protein
MRTAETDLSSGRPPFDLLLPLADEDCSQRFIQDAAPAVDTSDFLAQISKLVRAALNDRHVRAPARATKGVTAQVFAEIPRASAFHSGALSEWLPDLIARLCDVYATSHATTRQWKSSSTRAGKAYVRIGINCRILLTCQQCQLLELV